MKKVLPISIYFIPVQVTGTVCGIDKNYNEFNNCNGPGVVQRKDRQKKEFHDQSDYR